MSPRHRQPLYVPLPRGYGRPRDKRSPGDRDACEPICTWAWTRCANDPSYATFARKLATAAAASPGCS